MTDKVKELLEPIITRYDTMMMLNNNDLSKIIESNDKAEYVINLAKNYKVKTARDIQLIDYICLTINAYTCGMVRAHDMVTKTESLGKANMLAYIDNQIKEIGQATAQDLYTYDDELLSTDFIYKVKETLVKSVVNLVNFSYNDEEVINLVYNLLTSFKS